MSKPSLSFYTNIPTPYQRCFFDELAKLFTLTVVYYASTEANRQWKVADTSGYNVITLQNNFIAKFFQRWMVDFHFSWKIFSVVRRDRSDFVIVSASYWIPNSVVALVGHRLKKKAVVYFSEPLYPVTNKFKYALKWLVLRIPTICCRAIFCIGTNSVKSFEYYRVTLRKFIIVYNIDPLPFQQLNQGELNQLASQYKPDGELIVLSSGALVERKGMDTLIKAFRQIPMDNVRLLIIGDGPEKQRLADLIAGDDRIRLEGFKTADEIPYFFGIADVFAFASRYDGWGVVINEALAAGLPVISSNKVGAAVHLFRSSADGILCDPEDVEDFKAAMELLLTNSVARNGIRQRAKNLTPQITSQYNAERVLDLFLNHFN